MQLIDHPPAFTEGTRVLLLKGRHKDGLQDERSIPMVTHDARQFHRALTQLSALSRPGERIYASAGARSLEKAAREFKRRQLDADYEPDRADFYRNLTDRWVSCLMVPSSQDEKVWFFDCDEPGQADALMAELKKHYVRPMPPYRYPTKSGEHVVVQAFNISLMSPNFQSILEVNALMLWGY